MTRDRETIRLATRGSDLALAQAGMVGQRLERRRLDVELVEVETTGDQLTDELIHRLGTTGAFVRSLDQQVLDGEVDAAVHSMKDMPTEYPDDLVVAAIPERATAGDLLVTPAAPELPDHPGTLDALPEGAVVGTSSLRRRAQLLAARPDLDVEPLRGNVDTRIEKLLAPALQAEHQRRQDAEKQANEDAGEDDYEREYDRTVEEWFDDLRVIDQRSMERAVDVEYDAIVLAAAGLERSGLVDKIQTDPLPTKDFVPAPGQGAIAVTMRDDSEALETVRDRLDHSRTRVETITERVVLAELGGGCVAPIGVYARIQGEYVTTAAQVLSEDGETVISEIRDLPVEQHAVAAREFASDLADRGAADLIEAAKREEPDEAKREG